MKGVATPGKIYEKNHTSLHSACPTVSLDGLSGCQMGSWLYEPIHIESRRSRNSVSESPSLTSLPDFAIQRSVVGSRDLSLHFRLEFQFQLDSYIFPFLTGFFNFTYSSSACDFALSVSRLGIDRTALS